MQINEEKRKKFMEYAGKRVNNVLHDIQILEPMSRSNSYDFTKQDVEEMFNAMQESLNNAKAEFEKKFDEKARSEKKVFSFGSSNTNSTHESNVNIESQSSNLSVHHENSTTIKDNNLEDNVWDATNDKTDTISNEIRNNSIDSDASIESDAF